MVPCAFVLVGCDQAQSLKNTIIETVSKNKPSAQAAKTPVSTTRLVGGSVHTIAQNMFEAHMNDPERLVVADFYADWCGPCRMLAPTLDAMAREFPENVLFIKINVDQNRELARKMNVRGIPDVRFFYKGNQVDRFNQNMPAEEVRAVIAKHAPKIEKKPANPTTVANSTAASQSTPNPQKPVIMPSAAGLAVQPPPKTSAPAATRPEDRPNPATPALGMLDRLKQKLDTARDKAPQVLPEVINPDSGNEKTGEAAVVPPIVPIKKNEEYLPPGITRGKVPLPSAPEKPAGQ